MLMNNSDQSSLTYAGDHFADLSAMLMGVVVVFVAFCLLVSTYQRTQVVHDTSTVSDTR